MLNVLDEFTHECLAIRVARRLPNRRAPRPRLVLQNESAKATLNSGAPRSMKMGTTRSPWRYDTAIRHALQSANLRRPAILHYASSAAVSPISQGGPVTPR
jgi:hypothetical protein